MAKRSEDYKAMFSPPALRLAWERYVRSAQREAKDYLGSKHSVFPSARGES